MKRLAITASVAAALALSSAALAAGTLSGTYKTKITGTALGGSLNGTWTIKFKSGNYTVTDEGIAVVHGKYSIKGTKITLNDKSGKDACPGPGIYKFKPTGKKLKFTRVSDPNENCIGRVTVLAGSYTKVG